MTEAKSPREIANSDEVTALCEALERAMRSFGHISTAHYERPCREAMAAALLSYAAERERLLADADEVIVAAYGEIPEHGIGDNRRRLITEAFKRFRLRSLPATEGKGDD